MNKKKSDEILATINALGLSLEKDNEGQAIVYLGVVKEGDRLRHLDEDDCNQVDEADRTEPKSFLTDDEAKRFRSLVAQLPGQRGTDNSGQEMVYLGLGFKSGQFYWKA